MNMQTTPINNRRVHQFSTMHCMLSFMTGMWVEDCKVMHAAYVLYIGERKNGSTEQ